MFFDLMTRHKKDHTSPQKMGKSVMDTLSPHDASNETAFYLSSTNVSTFVKGLPAKTQLALRSLAQLESGSLTLQMPDKRIVKAVGKTPGPDATLILHNWNIVHKALTSSTIGVAEAYMDGDWESPDVTAFLELLVVNEHVGNSVTNYARGLLVTFEKLRHWWRSNSRGQAKKNISAHYDLGNDFYAQWLDKTMTYSSALFEDGANDLASAQTAKYRTLAEAAGIKRGDNVLEIGCGWGGFAEYAASELDCHVTGLSLSREQLKYAEERLAKLGLSDKVDFKYQDYRDENGVYDSVISIEMFEAVGEAYWPVYFDKIKQCLKQGGKAALQVITITPENYATYRQNPDFIQRYIFPGGMLPSDDALPDLGKAAELKTVSNREFGLDYARTLAEWREEFWANWATIAPLGFDERFKRLWEFYLFYCEAGFRAGNINVRQIVYENT
jgi:cyclopropane-fatty-acyl-phospholipid synthase